MQATTRVLYIGGMTRTGSTLLDRSLDQLPGVCSVGELGYMWARGLRDNLLCACGAPFGECPFWTEVGRRGFGGWETLDVGSVLELQHAVQRNRFIPAFVAPAAAPAFRRRQAAYAGYLGRLYRGIAEAAGAEVVVDGTKIPAGAYMAWRTPNVDLRLLHIVRDSRAVAYSWTKPVRMPEAGAREMYFPVYSPARASVMYDSYNASYELLRSLGVPTLRLRYEDFIADPRGTLGRLAEFVGLSPAPSDLEFVDEDRVDVTVGHSAAGNPMRFKTGRLPLRLDDAWRSELPTGRRRTVSLLTAPLRLLYGYRS